MVKNKKMNAIFLGVFAVIALVGIMVSGAHKTEAAGTYLSSNLTVKEDVENYVVTYRLDQVKKGAAVHLSFMSRYGEDLGGKGIIAKPEKAGTYQYEISKMDLKENEGFILEYKTDKGQILDGWGKHLIVVNGVSYY